MFSVWTEVRYRPDLAATTCSWPDDFAAGNPLAVYGKIPGFLEHPAPATIGEEGRHDRHVPNGRDGRRDSTGGQERFAVKE